MKRQLVLELWNSYRREVIPAEAPDVQVIECRRAFYAGAKGLLRAIEACLDPTSPDETPGDMAQMQAISDELDRFAGDTVKYGNRHLPY